MVREAARIDVTEMPDVVRLVEEIVRTKQAHVLQQGGVDVAILSPARPSRRKTKTITPAQRDAVLASIGGWECLVDAEQLKRDLDAARSDSRPPIEL